MNDPIDIDLFLSQLADDECLALELRALAFEDAFERAEARDAEPGEIVAEVRTALDAHKPADSPLDQLVARAVVVMLECQLRGLDVLHDGDRYEAELRASFAELQLPEQQSSDGDA